MHRYSDGCIVACHHLRAEVDETVAILFSFSASKSNGNTEKVAKDIGNILAEKGYRLEYRPKLNNYQCIFPEHEQLAEHTFTSINRSWGTLSDFYIDVWNVK